MTGGRRCVLRMAAFFALVILLPAAGWTQTVRDIEQRGVLRCAVMRAPGFAATDADGRPAGFMVDLCRALAAAVLGDAEAVDIRRLAKPQEFAALEAGDVDVSFAQTTWTLARDMMRPLDFGPPVFYDQLSVAAWRDADGGSPLSGRPAAACAAAGSTALTLLEDLTIRHARPWTVRPLPNWSDVLQAFLSRECAVAAADRAVLLNSLAELTLGEAPLIVDEPTARQPIAPLTSNQDRDWQVVVRWAMYALFLAEEKGVTARNASQKRSDEDGETRRLLSGGAPEAAQRLGLHPDWAFRMLTKVGNYGEIFDRNLGEGSAYRLSRGPNRPWTQGGLLYAPAWQ